jgi:hypothetical protein
VVRDCASAEIVVAVSPDRRRDCGSDTSRRSQAISSSQAVGDLVARPRSFSVARCWAAGSVGSRDAKSWTGDALPEAASWEMKSSWHRRSSSSLHRVRAPKGEAVCPCSVVSGGWTFYEPACQVSSLVVAASDRPRHTSSERARPPQPAGGVRANGFDREARRQAFCCRAADAREVPQPFIRALYGTQLCRRIIGCEGGAALSGTRLSTAATGPRALAPPA